jgi:hypothetical protein
MTVASTTGAHDQPKGDTNVGVLQYHGDDVYVGNGSLNDYFYLITKVLFINGL